MKFKIELARKKWVVYTNNENDLETEVIKLTLTGEELGVIETHYRALGFESLVLKNARQCTICGSGADMHHQNRFECQKNPNHMADLNTGIFTDCTFPEKHCPFCEGEGWYPELVGSSLPWDAEQKQCEACLGTGKVQPTVQKPLTTAANPDIF